MKLLALLVALLAAGAVTGCGARAEPTVETGDDAVAATAREWTTYRDSAHGFSVTYPSDWFRATSRLTPHLDDPREIVALATYPVRPGGDRCAHLPVRALDDLGPADAFLTLQERREGSTGSYDARPERFQPPSATTSEVDMCLGRGDLPTAWVPFREDGRAFYALYAVGPDADAATRADLLRVLDSLEFEPRR